MSIYLYMKSIAFTCSLTLSVSPSSCVLHTSHLQHGRHPQVVQYFVFLSRPFLVSYRVFIDIVFFLKNFQHFAPAALGCYWQRKWSVNRSECTLRFQIRWVALLQAGDGLRWIGKKHNFLRTPCITADRTRIKGQPDEDFSNLLCWQM